ncbi:hypothetical protein [Geodermatophilus sp. SYSU D00815]
MTDVTVRRPGERRAPDDAPDLPGRSGGKPADPPPAPAPAVDLTRLIALARLTAAQAVEIAAQVLAAADQRSAAGTGDALLGARQVRVDADGHVVTDGTGNGRPPAVPPGGPAVAAVLADVAGAARRRTGRADPEADRLLAGLDRAVAELPVAGVPAVARSLEEAAAAIDRGAVRAELAALVRAILGGPPAAGGAAPAAPARAGDRPTPAARAARGRSGSAARRVGAWLFSLVVLAAVVALEVAVLSDEITTDIGVLLDAGRSGSAASEAPEPDGLPVEAPAPASAGAVAAVDLRPLAPCAPGAPCEVRLLVRLVPGAAEQPVAWSYRVVDRCSGATQTAPGGTVTVPPGGARATAVGTVALPPAPAVTVIAVTDVPAAAASAPVVVGSCRSGDQAG